MNINYLENPWSEITRDERFFCAELFQILKDDKNPFLELLKIPKGTPCDIGYEVCFYRDYIVKYGYGQEREKNHQIKTIDGLKIQAEVRKKVQKELVIEVETLKEFPFKRTFDLCLFLENEIIIIEAKAHQRFETKQLSSFDRDRALIMELLDSKISNVKVIGLCSSDYTPSVDTRSFFEDIITWKDLFNVYPNEEVLKHANDVFPSKTKKVQK